jgi:energy-converting hydrogenase Eha subunit C
MYFENNFTVFLSKMVNIFNVNYLYKIIMTSLMMGEFVCEFVSENTMTSLMTAIAD